MAKAVAKKKAAKKAAKKVEGRELSQIIDDIEAHIDAAKENRERFEDDQKKVAAGRLRKNFQEIKVLCQEGRNRVTEIKAEM